MASPPESIRKCKVCSVTGSECKLCSRCKIIRYCSVKCQQEDFEDHVDTCKTVKYMRNKVKRLEAPLHFQDGEDIFKTSVGMFWGLNYPREYCRIHFDYAEELVQIGINDDNVLAYELGLSHYLELLRLSHRDNQGVRYYVPFVLLVLNHLEDCYGFIKWWAIEELQGNYVWGRAPPKGKWAYLKNQDILEDLFQDKRVNVKYFEYSHLLALILMKIMIMQHIEKTMNEEWKAFLLGTDEIFGKGSHVLKIANNVPVIDKIHGYLKENSGLSAQEALMRKYCKMLDAINPRILKALAFPEPLMSQEAPFTFSRGAVSGAYHVLSCGLYAFQKTGANEKIIEMYGKQPHYDHKLW